jgi:hypothetical protein
MLGTVLLSVVVQRVTFHCHSEPTVLNVVMLVAVVESVVAPS